MQVSRPSSPGLTWLHWVLFLGTTALTLVLGLIGHDAYARHHGLASSPSANLYMTLQLFILHSPHLEPPLGLTLEAARFLSAGILGYGAALAFLSAFGRFLRLEAVGGWLSRLIPGGRLRDALRGVYRRLLGRRALECRLPGGDSQ